MALMQCSFFAESLGVCASMNVIIPETAGAGQIGIGSSRSQTAWPVLYLFHGLSDDHSIWLRRTSIERYVADLGLAVVMPAVNRSFYTDMRHGGKYFTFVSEELPRLVKSFFHISDRREDTFVAGLSMGGYGAFKLALRCPDRYAAAASLSGVADIASRQPDWPEDLQNIFGDQPVAGSKDDLFAVSRTVAASVGPRPALFQCCGTEDFLYADNQRLRDHLTKLQYEPYVYREAPGTHGWEFWDRHIQEVLQWLPLSSKASPRG